MSVTMSYASAIKVNITIKDSCKTWDGWRITYNGKSLTFGSKIVNTYTHNIDDLKQLFNMDEIESFKVNYDYQQTNNLVEEF